MIDRGMMKWAPFNSLLNGKDVSSIVMSREKTSKPALTEESLENINEKISEAMLYDLNVEIKYWNIDKISFINGKITKVDVYDKYLLIDKIKIAFKNIIDVNLMFE